MRYLFIKIGFAYFAATMIAACSSSDDTSGTADQTGTDPALYVGSWTTGCVISQFPVVGSPLVTDTFFTYNVQIDTTTWQFVQSGYLDESCTMQELEIPDTGTSTRGTVTIIGSYTDEGEITTADGLQASNLRLTVDTFTNTLDEPGDEFDSPEGTTNDSLFYVNDADVLFIDDNLLGISEQPGSLVLTLPFSSVQQ